MQQDKMRELCDGTGRHYGQMALIALLGIGLIGGIHRFFFGLEASTNLSQRYPWGLWIVADVSLIALAAGGFVTAGIAHILHRHRYEALVRPALLTALLGYTCACVLLAADLGRYYNIWHPLLPSMWQGNSALFEVGMCVMCYLTVLYLEFAPCVCERFAGSLRHPTFGRCCKVVLRSTRPVISVLIVAGVAISCLHQSSLGHVMVIAPSKLHALWWTPVLSLMFLMSAVIGGIATTMVVAMASHKALEGSAAPQALAELSRYLPILLAIYVAFKLGDMVIRQSYRTLLPVSLETVTFAVEIVVGVIVPLLMLMSARVRRTPWLLATASACVMAGVVLNRANVYWLGFRPLRDGARYVPSLTEWGFTIGVVAALILAWRLLAARLPIITTPRHRVSD